MVKAIEKTSDVITFTLQSRLMKIYSLLFLLFITLLSCTPDAETTSTLTKYIPRKAGVILKTSDLNGFLSETANNDLIQELKSTGIYKKLAENKSLIEQLSTEGEVLLCFTKLGRDDYDISLITELNSKLLRNDSIKKSVITPFSQSKNFAFLIEQNVLIASSSKLLLENVERELDNREISNLDFNKAYNSASSSASATLFVKGEEAGDLWRDILPNASTENLKNSFNWTSIDLDFQQNDIRLNGVVLVQDSTDQKFNLLRNTRPVRNRIAEIAPLSAHHITSITFQDWSQFKINKARLLKIDISKYEMAGENLLSSFQEIGELVLPEGKAIIAISNDVVKTEEALIATTMEGEYRKVEMRSINDSSAFAKAYTPLLELPEVKYFINFEDLYVFAENKVVIEAIIANYQNNATFAKSTLYQNTQEQLSSASSFLHITNLTSENYKKLASSNGQKVLNEVTLSGYNYAALQLVQENNYLLLNGIIQKTEKVNASGGVTQVASVKLNAPLTLTPQFVKNHRTKGMDIITQDVNNVLYLISNTGKVLWQKEMDGQVKGPIEQVDLYRNGRLQLAFTTSNSFYVLDRNGKEVAPFPLTFKDNITQPLAVFDYDSNRKYRFVIVQNNKVMMYDRDGKSVTGFKFNEAPSEIVLKPEHLRLANKDYILLAEKSGMLNILSRTGEERVKVDGKIMFGDAPFFKDGNYFATYSVNGERVRINTSGKITQEIQGFSSDSKIALEGKNSAGLRENELIINGKKTSIPFGSYAFPEISKVGSKVFVGITNTESSEVFLYDASGNLLKNFPVYGTSQVDIDYLNDDKNLGFVTQGSDSSILIYSLN